MRNLKSTLMGSAALVSLCAVPQLAQAQTPPFITFAGSAFGAGSTAAQIVYRQMNDCLFIAAHGSTGNPGPLALSSACSGTDLTGFAAQVLYAGTGSGNGKSTFISNSTATLGAPSGSIPFTDQFNQSFSSTGIVTPTAAPTAGGYDGIQFAGTDDPWNAADQAAYVANSGPTKFGNPIMIPTIALPIAFGFNGTDGAGAALHIPAFNATTKVAGLNLSRQAVCGIVSGHIATWNNSVLTASNGGTTMGTGQLTFVHRQDGSGSTFLVTNGLATQCATVTGPNTGTDATTVSYALPWSDRTIVAAPGNTTYCPTGHSLLPIQGSDQLNFPDQFSTDQCGNAVSYPTGSGALFVFKSGSGALAGFVATTNGSIGYASVDFWAPISTTNTHAFVANVQNQYSIAHNTLAFVTPNAASALSTVNETVPPTSPATADAITWGLQGTIANPVGQGSYPYAGFTWMMLYQCYQTHPNGNGPLGIVSTMLNGLYGSPSIQNVVALNGFASVPAPWTNAITTLFTTPSAAPTTGCSGITGAY